VEIGELMQSAAPLLAALHDGVAVSDAAGVVVYVNAANARITGLRATDLVGRPVREVVPDSHLLQALQTGRELVGVRTQVAGREVVSNIVPLYDGGRLIGAVSVFRDLTEVLGLTAQLQEAHNTIALLQGALTPLAGAEGMVVGRSPAAQKAVTLALRAAAVGSPVLIEGESGTGKEVVARLIHRRSDRAQRPLVAVNCAALPGPLLESELFGYVDGAFTGARRGGRAGLFEMAEGGTLFLDEIGDMDPGMQAKLLRVLQDGEYRRLGSGAVRRADVRLLSATNRPLAELVTAHLFRDDLYYRLRVIHLELPPLRERREDLPDFLTHALARAAQRLGRPVPALAPEAMRPLLAYSYPGNVRELENLVEQALVLDDDGVISEGDLPPDLTRPWPAAGLPAAGFAAAAASAGVTLPDWEQAERELLTAGLRQFRSKTALAAHLGIGRATLYRKLARYGLG